MRAIKSGGSVTATTAGTANTVAKFTTSKNIGNSSITDNGTTVATTEAVNLGTAAAWVVSSAGLPTKSNGITIVQQGYPLLVGYGRVAAVVNAASTSIATFTVGAADSSFVVSANVLITVATTHSFSVTCSYTDEGNTARVATFDFLRVAGGVADTLIINTGGAVPYMGIPLHIRCKAATGITIGTSAITFTTVTYNAEGLIQQVV